MKRFGAYALTSGVAIGLAAWLGIAVFGTRIGVDGVRAVVMSAGVAFTVQCLTFGVSVVLLPSGLMLKFGAAALMRLFTIVAHGIVGVQLMGLPAEPALMSLVLFLFGSMLIEPFFLPTASSAAPAKPSAPAS